MTVSRSQMSSARDHSLARGDAEPSAAWEEEATGVVKAATEALDRRLRQTADELYELLLDGVQDYLLDNVLHNVRQQIDSAERQALGDRYRRDTLERENARLRSALSRCAGLLRDYAWAANPQGLDEADTKALNAADAALSPEER